MWRLSVFIMPARATALLYCLIVWRHMFYFYFKFFISSNANIQGIAVRFMAKALLVNSVYKYWLKTWTAYSITGLCHSDRLSFLCQWEPVTSVSFSDDNPSGDHSLFIIYSLVHHTNMLPWHLLLIPLQPKPFTCDDTGTTHHELALSALPVSLCAPLLLR